MNRTWLYMLPKCRYRGKKTELGYYPCASEKLLKSPAGVWPETCRICPYPDVPSDGHAILRLGPFERLCRLSRFVARWAWHVLHGMPWAPPEVRAERQEMCRTCDHLTGDGYCGKCGCGVAPELRMVLNKTAYALEQCPLPEPRWLAVKGETLLAWLKRKVTA